ncbi:unnamed protein product [Clavelina lepadiformis]|uniref:Coenzyme Q-binding protein COQ10 START domain-containing protein n=1 Tax=Clavelina lepadiformis TaxID=159417 RepID=A0ABP0GM19_CLALP
MNKILVRCKPFVANYFVKETVLCYFPAKLCVESITATFDTRHYASMFAPKTKQLKHSDRKCVAVPMDVMYKVVADVDSYKHFIPWCTESIVTSRSDKSARAKLTVGFGPIQEHYVSTLVFNKPQYVKAISSEGRLFHLMDCTWRFTPGPSPSMCFINFDVIFEFRSRMYTKLANMFFNEVVKKMVSAFEKRAIQEHRHMMIKGKT